MGLLWDEPGGRAMTDEERDALHEEFRRRVRERREKDKAEHPWCFAVTDHTCKAMDWYTRLPWWFHVAFLAAYAGLMWVTA